MPTRRARRRCKPDRRQRSQRRRIQVLRLPTRRGELQQTGVLKGGTNDATAAVATISLHHAELTVVDCRCKCEFSLCSPTWLQLRGHVPPSFSLSNKPVVSS